MINLLPPETRDSLKRLYLKRLIIFMLLILFLLIAVSAVLLLPSYFIFSVRNKEAKLALESAESASALEGLEEALATVKEVNKKIALLDAEPAGPAPSVTKVLSRLVADASGLVKLDNFSQSADGKITLRGTAPTRNSLLAFIRRLEQDEIFSRVDSPISNLVAERNIRFLINLELKAKKDGG